MSSRIRYVSFVLLVSACADRVATPSPVARTEPPAPVREAPSHGSIRSPLQIAWVPVQFDARRAVLRARVEWSSRLELPLTLHVAVPDGVRVIRGEISRALPSVQQTPVSEYEYELTYDRLPDTYVLLTVDGDGESMGVHARAAFRFGRPEPLGPMPTPEGPPLVIGGRNFGSAIPATR